MGKLYSIWIMSSSVQFSSVAQLCPTLCDPMDCSTPGFPVHCQLLEFIQTHVHWVSDAIKPSRPLSSPSPPTFSLSQHQGFSNELALCIRWPKYTMFFSYYYIFIHIFLHLGSQKTDVFEQWCCRRLLRLTSIAKRSNQSILKEINPEYALEGLMLKLKIQYFGMDSWLFDT